MLRGLLIFMWTLLASVIIAFQPHTIGVICEENCVLAENVGRIVSSPRGNVGAELKFLELGMSEKLFTEAEVSHLEDVGRLMQAAMILWVVTSIVLVFLGKNIQFDNVTAGFRLTVFFFGILGLLVFISWETFFEGFHRVFFPQGNWAFPVESKLLGLYPEYFWQKMGVVVIGLTLFVQTVLVLVFLLKKKIAQCKDKK